MKIKKYKKSKYFYKKTVKNLIILKNFQNWKKE